MRKVTKIKTNEIYDILGIFSFGQIVPKNKEIISSKINHALDYCHDEKPCELVHKGTKHYLWASNQESAKIVLFSKMTLSVTYRIHKFSHKNREIRHKKIIWDKKTRKEKEINIYQWLWDKNCSICQMANHGINLLEDQYQKLISDKKKSLKELYRRKSNQKNKLNWSGYSKLNKAQKKSLERIHKEIYKDIEIHSTEELKAKAEQRFKSSNRILKSKSGLTIHTDKRKMY